MEKRASFAVDHHILTIICVSTRNFSVAFGSLSVRVCQQNDYDIYFILVLLCFSLGVGRECVLLGKNRKGWHRMMAKKNAKKCEKKNVGEWKIHHRFYLLKYERYGLFFMLPYHTMMTNNFICQTNFFFRFSTTRARAHTHKNK